MGPMYETNRHLLCVISACLNRFNWKLKTSFRPMSVTCTIRRRYSAFSIFVAVFRRSDLLTLLRVVRIRTPLMNALRCTHRCVICSPMHVGDGRRSRLIASVSSCVATLSRSFVQQLTNTDKWQESNQEQWRTQKVFWGSTGSKIWGLKPRLFRTNVSTVRCSYDVFINDNKTSMKGTVGPGRRPLAYLVYSVITVSPACA